MPRIDLLALSLIPANLPIDCAMVSKAPPPNNPDNMFDPVSASVFWPSTANRVLFKVSSEPDCCCNKLNN